MNTSTNTHPHILTNTHTYTYTLTPNDYENRNKPLSTAHSSEPTETLQRRMVRHGSDLLLKAITREHPAIVRYLLRNKRSK